MERSSIWGYWKAEEEIAGVTLGFQKKLEKVKTLPSQNSYLTLIVLYKLDLRMFAFRKNSYGSKNSLQNGSVWEIGTPYSTTQKP